MPKYIDNAAVIKNTLLKAMEAETPAVTKELLNTFVSQLQDYLLQLDVFNAEVADAYHQAQLQYANTQGASNSTLLYSTFKKIKSTDDNIDNLLKTGYVLIDNIRNVLTKETILYDIGTEYRGTLFEGSLTIEQLLQYTTVVYNSRSTLNNLVKLRMNQKSNLRQQELQAVAQTKVAQQGTSTVWSELNEFITKQSSATGTKAYSNKGNAYEVYKTIIARRGNQNKLADGESISDEEFESTFSAVRKNTVSYVQGGDLGATQIKFFSSAPSITTLSTIKTSLTQVYESFQQYLSSGDSGALTRSMEQLFTVPLDKTSEDIDAEAAEKARDSIAESISHLGIQVEIT